jgi:hypothetical protein
MKFSAAVLAAALIRQASSANMIRKGDTVSSSWIAFPT